jgi:hypothetical protein
MNKDSSLNQSIARDFAVVLSFTPFPMIVGTIISVIIIGGCARAPDIGGDRADSNSAPSMPFYEYEGGMINLRQVSQISTQASIRTSASPNISRGKPLSREEAIWTAHVRFCSDWIPTQDYAGGIEGSVRAIEEIGDAIAREITQEVLDTCKITIATHAEISLDAVSIVQEGGFFTLPQYLTTATDGSSLGNRVKQSIVVNVREPSMWDASYRSVIERMSFQRGK